MLGVSQNLHKTALLTRPKGSRSGADEEPFESAVEDIAAVLAWLCVHSGDEALSVKAHLDEL